MQNTISSSANSALGSTPGIGCTEDRSIGDLGMSNQQVFALLRVDVHASGDDHEGSAVGKMEEAVIIDIADIANRAHSAIFRTRFLGIGLIVEIFERRARLEPR